MDGRTDGQTDGRTDGRPDGRSGPTTRPAFAKATQVKIDMNLYAYISPLPKIYTLLLLLRHVDEIGCTHDLPLKRTLSDLTVLKCLR